MIRDAQRKEEKATKKEEQMRVVMNLLNDGIVIAGVADPTKDDNKWQSDILYTNEASVRLFGERLGASAGENDEEARGQDQLGLKQFIPIVKESVTTGISTNCEAGEFEIKLDEALKADTEIVDAELISLKDILQKRPDVQAGKTSSATYLSRSGGNDQSYAKLFVLTRTQVDYDDTVSQLLIFSDLTVDLELRKEKNKNKMLQDLNTQVHHEMVTPLAANMVVSEVLLEHLADTQHHDMVKVIHFSCKQLMLHAHDILDQSIILNGKFVPSLKFDSLPDAVDEIV